MVTLDIRSFFPSTLGWHVFEFFNKVMLCSRDVSGLLTALSTCDNHVPTGSCLSQIIAFYAHYRMFEEINQLAVSLGLTMTCYVDDITISGEKANRQTLYRVRGILKRRGLQSHPRKEYVYKKGQVKFVTGSAVVKDGLRLPNRKHELIHKEILSMLNTNDNEKKLELLDITTGRAIAASQSEPAYEKRIRALRNEKNRISKLTK